MAHEAGGEPARRPSSRPRQRSTMNADEPSPPESAPRGGLAGKLARWCAYALAGVLLLGAASLAGLRVLLPDLDRHRPAIEGWLSRITEREIELGAIDAHWRGWSPVFRIEDVRLAGRETPDGEPADGGTADGGTADGEPAGSANPTHPADPPDASIRLGRLEFSIDPLDLLRSGAFRPREITVTGASFAVVRRSDGTFAIGALGALVGLAPDAAHEGGGLARWAPRPASISLVASRILWVDERRGARPVPLDGVTLRLGQAGGRYRISGSFEPHESARIDFAMEPADGPPTRSWSGTAYVAAHDVDVARLPLGAGQADTMRPSNAGQPVPMQLSGAGQPVPMRLSGVVSATVWSTWEDGRPVGAEGTIHARSPGVVHEGRLRGFDEASASFRLERTPERWTLDARDLVVTTAGRASPPTSAGVAWTPPREGRDGAVLVNAERVRIEDLVALAPLLPLVTANGGPPESLPRVTATGGQPGSPPRPAAAGEPSESPMPSALFEAASVGVEGAPRGVIEDLRLSAPFTDRVEIARARATGRFTGLRIAPPDWPVSVDAADGRFEASGQGLAAEVAAGRLRVDAPDWLSQPLQGEKLAGALAAVPTPRGVRVRVDAASLATDAGTVTADGWMLAPRDGSEPEASVTVSLGASRLATVRELLADGVMPEPVSRWIEAAAPFGDLHEARLTWRGRLSAAALGDDDAGPGDGGAGPGDDGARLGDDDARPDDDGARLGDDGARPDDDGAGPDDDGAGPDDDGAGPDDDDARPDDDGARLGDDGARLGDDGARLEATGRIVAPVLDYAPGWPGITGLSAAVRFDGRRLDARIESGRILGSAIREAQVTIEDVDAAAPVVRVAGRVEGASANAVRFLGESPLRARFDPVIHTIAIRGDSTIDLDLSIPLGGDGRPAAVGGRIALDHNRLRVPGLPGALAAVNGAITFGGAAVESDGLAATWLGEPLHAVVGASPEVADATRLSVHGRLTPRLLAAYLRAADLLETAMPGNVPLLARVRGDAAWKAILDVPRAGSGAPATLRLASDLVGLSLDLPPPLGKAGGTARALGIERRIAAAGERITEIRYGAVASAVLRRVRDAGGFRLERGAIRIGDGRATLPDAPGLTVRGVAPELDIRAWQALLEDVAALPARSADTDARASQALPEDGAAPPAKGADANAPARQVRLEDGAAPPAKSADADAPARQAPLEDMAAPPAKGADAGADAPRLGGVREVSIDAGSVRALGARFPDARMRAARTADGGWRVDLAGPRLEGTVILPPDPGAGPVTADLERFVFEPAPDDAGSTAPAPDDAGSTAPGLDDAGSTAPGLDPGALPPLSFSARRVVLGDYDLGRVGFATAPSEGGLALERLDVRAGAFEAEATGRWSRDDAGHRTGLAMRMHGADLGRMLGSFGFDGDAVAGGTTDISLRGSWPGTPGDFALDRLAGVMHFRSTDGRLTQIERGVTARVFGLLTITSLPRRLILDFGDLFRGGFEYGRIEGSFAIENGNAHTDDLFMESDTARLEVVGRTGLVDRDYDKLVTVIPKISSGLPFVPLWIAQQILDRKVFDKAFAYQYTITGPWDAPAVELVRTEPR